MFSQRQAGFKRESCRTRDSSCERAIVIHAAPIVRLEGLADFEEAAQIYRTCRSAGHTLRNQLDCLIAVPVIRHGASLLHNDSDFETIAHHTSLKLERLQ